MKDEFEIRSGGSKISGIVEASQEGKLPTMILCHGTTNDRHTCPLIERAAQIFVKRGIRVVRFDFYGSGESDGLFQNKQISLMIQNLRDILDYVTSRHDVDRARIGLWGRSVGGTVAAALSSPNRIHTNVLISTPVLLRQTFLPLFEKKGKLDYTPLGVPGHEGDVSTGRVKGKLALPRAWFEELDAIEEGIASNLRGMSSVLVVQGADDWKVSVDNAQAIFDSVHEPKELHIIPGADHSYLGHETEVLGLVESWLASRGMASARPSHKSPAPA